MKRRVLSVLLCAGLVVSVLAGCGSDDAKKDSGKKAASESDLDYVKEKGTLVVGITNFEPMDYQDEEGEWIGFDADMAKAFGESLGVDVEFVEIDWDNKILELDGKTIDCVWNGMTLTEEVTSSMECTDAYLNNAQVICTSADKADKYQDEKSLSDLSFAVESGSAGEDEVENRGLDFLPVLLSGCVDGSCGRYVGCGCDRSSDGDGDDRRRNKLCGSCFYGKIKRGRVRRWIQKRF